MSFSRPRLFLLAGLFGAYAVFLAWYHCPYAGGSDSSGYLNSARLLLEGRLSVPLRTPEGLTAAVLPRRYLFPLGFRLDATQENLLPTYPVGLPLHFAALGWLIGLEPAATVVGVFSALAFALLLYFTGLECGVRPGWSLAMTAVGALSPLTLTYALQAMSDLVATCWALALIFCALRSVRHAGWAAGAGASLAVAVLVRPTNALLLLPAALALHPSVRTWIAFVLGGLPGALFLAGYNHALYGTYVTSGYGDVSSLFAARHIPPTLWHYARWLPVVATPLVLASFALPWLETDRRKKFMLLAWAGGVLLFYSTYECTQETWWYLRFVLPALPALGIAAALGLQRINYPSWILMYRFLPAGASPASVSGGSVLRLPLAFLLLVTAISWLFYWDRELRVTKTELDDRTYPEVGRWVARQLPERAMVAVYQVSGAVLYYSDRPFVNPFGFLPDDYARFSAWLDQQHRPLYAVLYPFEEEAVMQRMPGRWEVVTHIRQATIWRRLAPGETTSVSISRSTP
ncbi:MAG TPA: hypothetical protein VIM71_10235 [Lacunisphaera sp.]